MRDRGFTIVELIVVMAIIGILLSIGTMQFGQMSRKAAVDGQTKNLQADLMTIRSEALFRKRARAVTVGSTSFQVYSSADTTATPVSVKTLKKPMAAATTIVFDSRGMAVSAAGADQAACIEPSVNDGYVDSIVVSLTRIQIGKRAAGGACATGNIEIR